MDGITPPNWDNVALEKLVKVFGPDEAHKIMAETLSQIGLDHLHSAQELYRFSNILKSRGAFASAVGALLGLTAVLRGATSEAVDGAVS